MTKYTGEHFLFESLTSRLQPYDARINLLTQDQTTEPIDIQQFSAALAGGFDTITTSLPNPEWVLRMAAQIDYYKQVYTDELAYEKQIEHDTQPFSGNPNYVKVVKSMAREKGISKFLLMKNVGLGWIKNPVLLDEISKRVTQLLIESNNQVLTNIMVRIGQSMQSRGIANIYEYQALLPELLHRGLLIENSTRRYHEWLGEM